MKSKPLGVFVVFVLMSLSALPAAAVHLKKTWEEKGQVSVDLFDEGGHQKIFFRGLPMTADRTPGPAVMRLNGVYIEQWIAPAYEFEFDVNADCISALQGDPKHEGQLVIPWLKSDGNQKVDLRRLTRGINTVEIYFLSKDDRGRFDRNRAASPATQFRVEEDKPPTAATTIIGSGLTPDQLDFAVKQSYEQGIKAGQDAVTRERDRLMAELRHATDELNRVRQEKVVNQVVGSQVGSLDALASPAASSAASTEVLVRQSIRVVWNLDILPAVGTWLNMTKDGQFIARAQVVEIITATRRLKVVVDLPQEFKIDGRCKFNRPTNQRLQQHRSDSNGYRVGERS